MKEVKQRNQKFCLPVSQWKIEAEIATVELRLVRGFPVSSSRVINDRISLYKVDIQSMAHEIRGVKPIVTRDVT